MRVGLYSRIGQLVELTERLRRTFDLDVSDASIAADDFAEVLEEARNIHDLFRRATASATDIDLDDLVADASVAIYHLLMHWTSLQRLIKWDPDLKVPNDE